MTITKLGLHEQSILDGHTVLEDVPVTLARGCVFTRAGLCGGGANKRLVLPGVSVLACAC
jgi:hypothetical protein